MGYSLGIDLGATTCVVALRRGAAVEVCRIGEDDSGMPAVALPRPDGSLLVGEAADGRSAYEPALVARYVVSRLGDGQPIDIDGHHLDPLTLTRAVLHEAMERAAPLPGVAPDHVVVTYPLLPGVGPEELIADAAAEEFGPSATLVPAPVAAVARLASERGLGDDAVVAVVDVGGSSVDVTLVRRTPTAFDLVGDPATLADLGGVDLDGAVLSLVEGAIGDVSSMVAPGDTAGMLALRRLRASCRAAKERLSVDDTAVVEVAMPNARGRVEITRDAFERTIEPALVEAIDLVLATIDDAGLIPADLRAVVVTGGSARIPRVTELLEQHTGLPVLVEARPEATVALGAALFSDVADDLAGPAAGAPGPVSGSPTGSIGGGRSTADAALGVGVAGALGAGLAGAAAAAVEGGGAGPGLPLTGMESIPPIGPTTGGGELPWEEAKLGGVDAGEAGADVPWAAPTDPWAAAPDTSAAPTDAWAAASDSGAPPTDPWAAAPDTSAPPTDPWGSAHDPWPSGPTPAATGDWGGPTDPWTSGSVPALPAGDVPATGPTAADWTTASEAEDSWTDAPAAIGPGAQDAWPGAAASDDPWADRGPRTQDAARGWDDWGHDRTTVFATAGGAGAPASGRSQDTEWGQTSDDEVRRLTTSDTDPFGRSGTLTSRLRSRSERSDADDDDGGGFDLRIVVGGLVAAAGVVLAGGYFALAANGGGDDPAVAVADTSPITSSTTTSTSTTTTVPPTTVAPTTETTEPPTTTTQPRPRPTTTTVPPTTAPPTTEPPTTAPPTTAPPTTTPPTTTPPGPPTTPTTGPRT
jgi:actin-like ATPase involved in cell morphogenesis